MANLGGPGCGCGSFWPVHRLVNPVMGYAWGSRTAIAELQGRQPAAEPEAELWLGAHGKAPSGLAGSELTLDRLIASDPTGTLGAESAAAHHGELPFLLKVLAAAEPLSLQVHPSFEQARNGYAREEALGIELTAPTRNYRDPHPKPELVCALTPFTALSGFREQAECVAIARAFDLDQAAERLAATAFHDALRSEIGAWLRLSAADRPRVVGPAIERAATLTDGPFAQDARWVRRLAALHPHDPGILVALLLRRYELQPMQALALDAGNLHAYLEGVAVEIMASSDNVLRGGLTPKHVDVEELLRILRFDAEPPQPTEPTPLDAQRSVYHTPFSQFVLERHVVRGEGAPYPLDSAAIVLVIEGALNLSSAGTAACALARGESAFVRADEQWLRLAGEGIAFVASVPHEATG